MSGNKVRYSAALVGIVLGICPGTMSSAWAQSKATPAKTSGTAKKPVKIEKDAATIEFDKHIAAGNEAADANRWDEARQEFLKALNVKPNDAQAIAHLAEAEIALGMHREAAEHLQALLNSATALSPEYRKIAEDFLEEARAKLATVTIHVNKPGATVSVDSRVIGTSPLREPVVVEMGRRHFEAESPEGRAKLDVELAPKTTPTIELVLKAPVAKVIIKESPKWRTGAIIGGAGLSVVGLGVGVGFIVAASEKHAEAVAIGEKINFERKTGEEYCPPAKTDRLCTELAVVENRRDTFASVGLAGFVVGGVAAVGTLTIWLVTRNKSTAEKPPHALVVLPSPQGLLVTGTF